MGRLKRPRTTIEALEVVVNECERLLLQGRFAPGLLMTVARARGIERSLTDTQVNDLRYPALLHRLSEVERFRRTGENPLSALQACIQEAVDLLEAQDPSPLVGQLLTILKRPRA